MAFVVRGQRPDVDVAQAVTVGGVKSIPYIVEAEANSIARIAALSGVDAFDIPIRSMTKVGKKILLQVAHSEDELVETVRRIDPHDLLDDWQTGNWHQCLRHMTCIRICSAALSATENHNFHAST